MAKPFYKLRIPQIRARAINKTTDLEFALFSWKTNFPFRFVSTIIPLQPLLLEILKKILLDTIFPTPRLHAFPS